MIMTLMIDKKYLSQLYFVCLLKQGIDIDMDATYVVRNQIMTMIQQ